MNVSGAVSGAVAALRATKTKQDVDILGGPGRTRTCNQTAMSGRKWDAVIDYSTFFLMFSRVYRAWRDRFWCETGAVGLAFDSDR
ncbi:hypothetical protein [Bradyrhizobium uaiense]|uniref:Uncharacterized protein n=1 Tax=Bradyrhizobium uaiense TaxID=2594946 RepID=A0A6P1BAM0_9BRAD|nr:hypothetical protein [Bradyrhizobium uaiense]NEU95496.1 hypothetical protein [Bradyrhizobium uaiense]